MRQCPTPFSSPKRFYRVLGLVWLLEKLIQLLGLLILILLGMGLASWLLGAENTHPLPEGFVPIPEGHFVMGDHHGFVDPKHGSDEIPLHTVHLNSFLMQQDDVTNEQFCRFLNAALREQRIELREGCVYQKGKSVLLAELRAHSPYSRLHWDGQQVTVLDQREKHPVVCLRWEGAALYCNWLSRSQGLSAVYDESTWNCAFDRLGYRLPTEAEWEYAARGGKKDPYGNYPWGDAPDASKANWPESDNPFRTGPLPWTTPVGFFDGKTHTRAQDHWPASVESYRTGDGSNGFGLHDMAGNVWQFVNDWYQRDYYRNAPADNPTGPASGSIMPDGKAYRGMRGGNWYNGEHGHARVSNRDPSFFRGPQDPNHPWYHVGFRVVLPLKAAPTQSVERGSSTAVSALPDSQTVGLFLNSGEACPGYLLFAPKHNQVTFLLNRQGLVVHQWKSDYEPGQSVYLKPDGHLIHCCFTKNRGFTNGGEGGRVEEFDWEGRLVWDFEYSNDQHLSHHDVAVMPNGHLLLLAVEKKSLADCVAVGFDPAQLRDGRLFPDSVIEVEPTPPHGGRIVWEWHVWDHLIQNTDRSKPNFGDPAQHPERIWTNANGRGSPAFWNHMNSIAYNPALDQILLSVRGCSEIWIIDHSTSSKEAAGSSGGHLGSGGDLLYRWGNPAAYGRQQAGPRQLIQQHDAEWIAADCPGAGHLSIFNNGYERGWSSIEEIETPLLPSGGYRLDANTCFGPSSPCWHYEDSPRSRFFSSEISGTQRLPNGNTLICAGVSGTLFEVTPAGKTVWRYVNPMVRGGILAQGESPGKDVRGHLFNAVFKAHLYAPDFPAFQGRDLRPQGPIELPASQRGLTGLDHKDPTPDERPPHRDGDQDRRPPRQPKANQAQP